MKELFEEVTKWQEETFPNANAISKVHHLKEEVDELLLELKHETPQHTAQSEFADCFILLFGSAKCNDMSYDDIVSAIKHKMELNRNRQWGKPDANGVVKHIKE